MVNTSSVKNENAPDHTITIVSLAVILIVCCCCSVILYFTVCKSSTNNSTGSRRKVVLGGKKNVVKKKIEMKRKQIPPKVDNAKWSEGTNNPMSAGTLNPLFNSGLTSESIEKGNVNGTTYGRRIAI